MSNKKLPSDYYDRTDGFFISKTVMSAFGRRRSFLVQFLLDKYEQAIKENKLIKGHAFISNEDFFDGTHYNYSSDGMKMFLKSFANGKWKFLSVESFGAVDGNFYRINVHDLFTKIIPKFKEDHIIALENSKFGPSKQLEDSNHD